MIQSTVARRLVIVIEKQMIPERLRPREKRSEKRPAQYERAQRVEGPARVLEASVRIDELRSDDAGVGMRIHELHEPVDRAFPHDDVGIQDENRAAAREPYPLVDAPRITEVLAVRDDAHARERASRPPPPFRRPRRCRRRSISYARRGSCVPIEAMHRSTGARLLYVTMMIERSMPIPPAAITNATAADS